MSVTESDLSARSFPWFDPTGLEQMSTNPGITPVAGEVGAENPPATQLPDTLYDQEKAALDAEIAELSTAMRQTFDKKPAEGYLRTAVDSISNRNQEDYHEVRFTAILAAGQRRGPATVTDMYATRYAGAPESATVLTALRRSSPDNRFASAKVRDIEDFTRLALYEGLAAQTSRPEEASSVLRNATLIIRQAVRMEIPDFDVERAGFGVLRQHAVYLKAALELDQQSGRYDLNAASIVNGLYFAVREVQLLQAHDAQARPISAAG